LLRSDRVDYVLCVGHSLGGALASIAAVRLGVAEQNILPLPSDVGNARRPPMLV